MYDLVRTTAKVARRRASERNRCDVGCIALSSKRSYVLELELLDAKRTLDTSAAVVSASVSAALCAT